LPVHARARDDSNVKTISSRHNPVVRAFRELAATPDRTGERLLLDGAHLVRDAQRAGLRLDTVVVSAARLESDTEEGALAIALERAGVTVLTADRHVFQAVRPVRTPSGIVAIACRDSVTPAAACEGPQALVLAAVDVQDPGNIGSLLRAAEAGGVTGALVCGASANPFSWKALRGAMGSTLRLPVAADLSVDDAMACMREARLRIVAAVPRGGDHPDAIDWAGPTSLVLGGEGPGLPVNAVEACDARVTIPMTSPVESLNVAVAGAILIYAARRQRE
jgi:TrmH family RNA methyltransferase